MINTVKTQESGYLVNGNMSVPNDPANRHYQMILDWINEGNTPAPEFTDAEIAAYDSQAYSRQRQAAYAALNQFEMQFDDAANSTTTWVDAIAAIKQEFPK